MSEKGYEPSVQFGSTERQSERGVHVCKMSDWRSSFTGDRSLPRHFQVYVGNVYVYPLFQIGACRACKAMLPTRWSSQLASRWLRTRHALSTQKPLRTLYSGSPPRRLVWVW